MAMRRVIDAFLAVTLTDDPADASKRARRQIVSLGAGFDTTWFRLRAEGREPARYIEVDHAPIVAKKAAIVNDADDMRALCVGGAGLAPLERPAESIVRDDARPRPTPPRHLATRRIPRRRRRPPRRSVPRRRRARRGFRPDPPHPRLLRVLPGVPPDRRRRRRRSVGGGGVFASPASAHALYDPMRPDDAFGRQMLLNLEARGCPLLGIRGVPTRTATWRVFARAVDPRGCVDMNDAHAAATRADPEGTRRAERTEMLDELEEWRLIQAHYCVAWGTSGTGSDAVALHEAVRALWR